MKKFIFPLCVVVLSLAVAKYFFGVDIEGLSDGFLDFLKDLLGGSG